MSNEGRFVWYELMTKDLAGARDFYTKLVGWTAVDGQMPGRPYAMFKQGDAQVAGLMELPEDARAMNAPPCWLGYVAVDDVDAALEKAKALGGSAPKPAMEIPDVGRFALIMDPQGAALMLFTPAASSKGTARTPGQPGHVGWHELYARDGAAVFDFYAAMFGWEKKRAMDLGPMRVYQTFGLGDEELGGVMSMPPGVPMPHWKYYLGVGNIDEAAARVKASGGTIQMEPHEIPGGGFITAGTDPQGASFALLGRR